MLRKRIKFNNTISICVWKSRLAISFVISYKYYMFIYREQLRHLNHGGFASFVI